MLHLPVYVRDTFVSTKEAKAPAVFIERLDDIPELLGELTCKIFEQLKEKINTIFDNNANGLYLHKDNHRIYRFDDSALPN